MSATARLREALESAPTMRVEGDAWGELAIWDADDKDVLYRYDAEARQNAMRLIGILLNVAPWLLDVLEADIGSLERATAIMRIKAAINQACEGEQ